MIFNQCISFFSYVDLRFEFPILNCSLIGARGSEVLKSIFFGKPNCIKMSTRGTPTHCTKRGNN